MKDLEVNVDRGINGLGIPSKKRKCFNCSGNKQRKTEDVLGLSPELRWASWFNLDSTAVFNLRLLSHSMSILISDLKITYFTGE